MRVHVLGSAAGGGFPQWNCNCRNCDGLRSGRIRAQARTQSSVAISADGASWILVDASPDILAQLRAFPEAQPARGIRDTAIAGIVLTDSQIDHTTGLLMLREGAPLRVYCTDAVRGDLTTVNPLESHGMERFHVEGVEGISLRAVPISSKAPPYARARHEPREGDTLGLQVTDDVTGKTLFYAPGLGRIDSHLPAIFERADCLLVDGTFWTQDEMVRAGISDKQAKDMGHLPQHGQGGMIEILADYPRPR